jgi:hypothetical protein
MRNAVKASKDHKNLAYTIFNTESVQYWRLILEEINFDLIYLPGDIDIVADALNPSSQNP